MKYKINSRGRPRKFEKYRTIRNFKSLKGFKLHKIKGNKIYFRRK